MPSPQGTLNELHHAPHNNAIQNVVTAPVNAVTGAVNTVGDVGSSIGSVLGDLTNINLWKGLGLILAGGLILIFAAIEFLHMSGNSIPKPI